MAIGNPTARDRADLDSTVAEDRIVESGVLGFVLSEHPTHLTLSELSLAMGHGQEDFAVRDDIERAIRELVGAGLLRIAAGRITPTRAALYFDTLVVG